METVSYKVAEKVSLAKLHLQNNCKTVNCGIAVLEQKQKVQEVFRNRFFLLHALDAELHWFWT